MRKVILLLMVFVFVLVFLPGISNAGERFDGTWHTKLTCLPKGDFQGYTWQFDSVIQSSNLRGEHGIAGEPGYLLIEGKIAQDGHAKLSAAGILPPRKSGSSVYVGQGQDYNYNIKAQFTDTDGTGTREQGLAIVARQCTFDFVKQQVTSQPSER